MRTLAQIRSKLDSLTNSEKRIAQFVLKSDPKHVIKMSITELAEKCGVSEATILRFVKKVGYESYQELKLNLALDYRPETEDEGVDISINQADTPENIVKKILIAAKRSIEDTAQISSLSDILNAVKLIKSAKRIDVYGAGASGAIARILQYKLIRLGYPASFIEDPHIQTMRASILEPSDIVIGISQSGSTKDTVDVLTTAKKCNATTVAITDHQNSPLSKVADIVIVSFSGENPIKTAAGKSLFAQLFIVEIMAGLLYSMDREKSVKAGKTTAEAVVNKLY